MIVAVAEAPEVTEAGLKATVTPEGAPEADRFTVCAEPLVVAVATVVVSEVPGAVLPVAGLAETEKSFAGVVSETACFHSV